MRQGQNPAKMGLKAYQAKPLGVATLSYIPNQEGYFRQSLEVLEFQINSLHNATDDFDLLVFDNGSCLAVQERLKTLLNAGQIDFLFLSRYNLGKMAALNWILSSMPHEWICYTDGDMIFRPGWYEKSRDIFQAFPDVGLVFAMPTLFDVLRGDGRTQPTFIGQAHYDLTEELISPQAVREYVLGVGLNEEQERGILQLPRPVITNTVRGTKAVLGAAHAQFLVHRDVARRIPPIETQLALSTKEDAAFNRKVDSLSLLQASTLEPLTYHAGNKLEDWARAEIERTNSKPLPGARVLERTRSRPASESMGKSAAFKIMDRLSRLGFVRRTLQRVYNLLFEFFAR